MKTFFTKENTTYVGHNIRRYDLPAIERLLGITLHPSSRVVDTLSLSWYLFPDRKKSYGLEAFGEDYGTPKPKITDWENLSLDEYIHRCEEDVKINTYLWNSCKKKLKEIYETEEEIWKFLAYLDFKMYCAHLAEKNKWKLDVEYCTNALDKLKTEQQEKFDTLRRVMPKVELRTTRAAPVKQRKKDGELSKKGEEWYALLAELNLPYTTQEVEVVVGYEDGNPASPVQIKDWLYSLGWKPTTFKYKKDKDGNEKQIPQINQEHGKGICDSIKRLYEKEPNLELLDGLSVLNHRIPILEGFLRTRDEEGYVKASVQGLTNTLRFKHSHPLVNLPKPEKAYAEAVRGSLTCPEGYELCGADMASLEDRLKQSFIYPLDPEYVKSMMKDDYDPHLELALTAEKITPAQMQAYKDGTDKSIKPTRDIFKNGNYACQYGAFPPRLVLTCDISLEEAKQVFEAYWKKNWAIKEISKQQEVKKLEDGTMWLKNPINGFYYSLRSDKDRFSTLVQGTASYVFDIWVKEVLTKTERLIGQFHDEIILLVKEGYRKEISEFLDLTIKRTNDRLKLNRELGIGIQYGKVYSQIH
jgi:hypothetical protein